MGASTVAETTMLRSAPKGRAKEKEKAKMEKGKREKAKEARERKLELATLAKELDTSQQTVGQQNGQNLKEEAKVSQKTGANPGTSKCSRNTSMEGNRKWTANKGKIAIWTI